MDRTDSVLTFVCMSLALATDAVREQRRRSCVWAASAMLRLFCSAIQYVYASFYYHAALRSCRPMSWRVCSFSFSSPTDQAQTLALGTCESIMEERRKSANAEQRVVAALTSLALDDHISSVEEEHVPSLHIRSLFAPLYSIGDSTNNKHAVNIRPATVPTISHPQQRPYTAREQCLPSLASPCPIQPSRRSAAESTRIAAPRSSRACNTSQHPFRQSSSFPPRLPPIQLLCNHG